MKFSTIDQAKKAIDTLPRDYGNRRVFPVAVKSALIELFGTLKITRQFFCDELGICTGNFDNWRKQHSEGLFKNTLGAISVSRAAKDASCDILEQLQSERNQLDQKIKLIKQCRELGLKVEAA